MFVRLTACDLRCRWCDTPYAFHEGRKMSVDEVVADVEARGCPTVEVTGGEPLLQADVYPLMQRLLDCGQDRADRDRRPSQHRQRAGGRDPHHGREVPGLRRSREERLVQPRAPAPRRDEVKFVIADRADYEFARDIVAARAPGRRACSAVLFSPVHGELDAAAARRSGFSPIACRSRAAAGAQVHLESGDARR